MNRRGFIAGAVAVVAAAAAGVWRFTDVVVKHYPPTPYDDLLRQLTDREKAVRLGEQVAGPFDMTQQAARLRATFARQDLGAAVNADIAANRLAEVKGWLLPETLVTLAALAAKA